MEKYCVYTYATKNFVDNCFVAIYSFLDNNSWFTGDIIIGSEQGVIADEIKNYLVFLYDKIRFHETEAPSSISENYSSFFNKNTGYETVLIIEDDVIVNSSLYNYKDKICGVFNIKYIDEKIVGSSEYITEENERDYGVIYFNNNETYANTIRERYIYEFYHEGPKYYFNTCEGSLVFHKDFNDRNKYVVCTCAKNENDYIIEWINHYLNLGFDKIFICDNNDIGNNSLYETVKEYVHKGVVEIFDCRHLSCFQVQFYSMFCTEGNYKWCGYFDCDEFLELPAYFNVKHYLSKREDELCVSFHWVMYGSNGKIEKESGSLLERFKNPVSPITLFTENCFIKSIVKGNGVFNNGCQFNGSHIPLTTPMYTHNVAGYFKTNSTRHGYFPPKYKDGYIRHYYTKSFSEWINKSKRGWPDGTDELALSNFFICDDWAHFSINKMRKGFFSSYGNEEEVRKYYEPIFEIFNVINVKNESENIYALLVGLYNMFTIASGNVYMLSNKHIEDTTFNILMEMAIRTDNKVVWVETEEDRFNVVNKYSKISDTYYNITFE